MSKLATQNPALKQQLSEDEAILQIKSIASEIFTSDDALLSLGFLVGMGRTEEHLKKYGRFYSYTERKTDDDRQECESQWIEYDSLQKQEIKNSANTQQIKNRKTSQNQKVPKLIHKEQKTKYNPMKKITKKVECKTPKAQLHTKPSSIQQNDQKLLKTKKVIQNLQQCGFMKPIRNLKQQVVLEHYRRKQMEQNEIKSSRKILKTLQQIYTEKEPLYDKFLKDKEKKIQLILESRITSQSNQTKYNKSKPDINSNIPVNGTFQERQKVNMKKAQENKGKILHDILKENPFQPQTNNSKKYQKVESVVKKSWSQKSIHVNRSLNLSQNRKYIRKFEIKNESLHDDKMYVKNNAIDLRIKSAKELCNILEMQVEDNYED